MKLILDWDSLVERVRLSIFAPWFLRDHTFCQTRSRFFSLFPPFTLSSLYADGRTKARPLYLSPCLLLSRCVSRGIGESKTFCCGFSRRTTPFSTFIALISPRMGHLEFKQLLFRLPLFKRGSILAEHEKVRGMQSLGRATGWPLVVQFQLVRLIKKLQNLSIIVNPKQRGRPLHSASEPCMLISPHTAPQ